jgi:hypothetical protein
VGSPWRRQLLDRANFEAPVTFRSEDNDVSRWLMSALAEYDTLRAESLQAMQAQQNILQFGIAGIAVLTGLGLQNNDDLISILILLFLVPLLSILILNVWFVEIFRSIRAGLFLACLEEKINGVIDGNVHAMQWETWLRDNPKGRRFVRDRMSFATLYIFNLASVVLAGYIAYHADFTLVHPAPVIAVFGLVSGALLLAALVFYRKNERLVFSIKIDLNAGLKPFT